MRRPIFIKVVSYFVKLLWSNSKLDESPAIYSMNFDTQFLCYIFSDLQTTNYIHRNIFSISSAYDCFQIISENSCQLSAPNKNDWISNFRSCSPWLRAIYSYSSQLKLNDERHVLKFMIYRNVLFLDSIWIVVEPFQNQTIIGSLKSYVIVLGMDTECLKRGKCQHYMLQYTLYITL